MSNFDFEIHRVVGLVDDKLGSHATIDVVGYCDSNFNFVPLSNSEAVITFPSRGKVFAPRFNESFKDLKGSIVCIGVKPKNNEGTDDFLWERKAETLQFGHRLIEIRGLFNNDGEHNFAILKKNDLLQLDNDEYVYSNGRVYQIKANENEGILHFWEETSIDLVFINDSIYIVGYSFPNTDGVIDITNNEQLANWYVSRVIKKNWSTFVEGKSFRHAETLIRELLGSLKDLDNSIVENRIKRLTKINTNLSLSFESIAEIAETPWFGEVVQNSISKERQNILEMIRNENSVEIQTIKDEHSLKLQQLKEQHKKEIDELNEQVEQTLHELSEKEQQANERIQEKHIELELLDEETKSKQREISVLEQTIDKLNIRKTSIVEDFSIIREVLGGAVVSRQSIPSTEKEFAVEQVNLCDKPMKRLAAFGKALENLLKVNKLSSYSPASITKLLAKYRVVLCPQISIAQIIILASQKCNYVTEYVSAKWSSFEDLWENGLGFIVTHASQNAEVMHYLILHNINITYLPNYMQPLVDIQCEVISKFPLTNVTFPDNLRILCTISDDELIPLSTSVLRHVGCIDKSAKTIVPQVIELTDNYSLGYLHPKDLTIETSDDVENYFQSYVVDE